MVSQSPKRLALLPERTTPWDECARWLVFGRPLHRLREFWLPYTDQYTGGTEKSSKLASSWGLTGGVFPDDIGIDLRALGWFSGELGIRIEIDMVEAEVAFGREGKAPFAVGGDAPAEVGGDGDALAAGHEDLADVGVDVLVALVTVGGFDAAIFNDQDLLVREQPVEAAEGDEEAGGLDGSVGKFAHGGIEELRDAVELKGVDAPVVVEADEVLLPMAVVGAEVGWKLAGHAEGPPVAIADGGEDGEGAKRVLDEAKDGGEAAEEGEPGERVPAMLEIRTGGGQRVLMDQTILLLAHAFAVGGADGLLVQAPLEEGGHTEDEGIGADLGGGIQVANGAPGEGMGLEEVAHEARGAFKLVGVLGLGREPGRHGKLLLPPGFHVAVDEKVGLVEGDPVGDAGTEGGDDDPGVGAKPRREVLGSHASAFADMEGPGEMVEGDERLQAGLADGGDDFLIVIEDGLIVLAGFGFDAGPGDGEAEELAAELGGEGDILGVAVPEVGGEAALGLFLRALPLVADVVATGFVGLGLMVGGGDAEFELGERGLHSPYRGTMHRRKGVGNAICERSKLPNLLKPGGKCLF